MTPQIKDIKTIDEYISLYPQDVQVHLKKLRAEIKKCAPTATGTIGYGIPTFKLNGNLIHLSAFTHHIGCIQDQEPSKHSKKS